MARKPLLNEEMETVGVALPRSIIRLLELGLAKGFFSSRADGARKLIFWGLEHPEFKALNIEAEPLGSLMILKNLAIWQSLKKDISENLLRLEEPLKAALSAGSEQTVSKLLDTVDFCIEGLELPWRQIAIDFIENSPVFTLAYERYKPRKPKISKP